jgi:hypothetical protein
MFFVDWKQNEDELTNVFWSDSVAMWAASRAAERFEGRLGVGG